MSNGLFIDMCYNSFTVETATERRLIVNKTAAKAIVGSLGFPSKMPGTAWGISAHDCKVGGKLRQVEGSTCSSCYAMKDNYVYPSVAKAHETRKAGLDNPAWVSGMVMLLRATHKRGMGKNGPIDSGWHRWFDSGDFQSVEHVAKICEVAHLTPEIRHWAATRELAMIAKFVRAGGVVPANLTVRVSATMVDDAGPKAWPTTSGVHHSKRAQGKACPAPSNDGKCGSCRACWDRAVPHVSYGLH